MTAAEFRAFIVEVRAEADAALARLETVDADALAAGRCRPICALGWRML